MEGLGVVTMALSICYQRQHHHTHTHTHSLLSALSLFVYRCRVRKGPPAIQGAAEHRWGETERNSGAGTSDTRLTNSWWGKQGRKILCLKALWAHTHRYCNVCIMEQQDCTEESPAGVNLSLFSGEISFFFHPTPWR